MACELCCPCQSSDTTELLCEPCDTLETDHRAGGELLPACGHTACTSCCRSWVKSELWWHVPAKDVRCFGEGCKEMLPESLVQEMCPKYSNPDRQASEPKDLASQLLLARFKVQMQSLTCQLVWSPAGGQITCPLCCRDQPALIRNVTCRHAVCGDCWTGLVKSSIPLHEEQRAQDLTLVTCPKPGCGAAVCSSILERAAKNSDDVVRFQETVRRQKAHLRRVARDVLVWGDGKAGPVCNYCGKRQLALLGSPDCSHAACESCWAHWCEQQLPHCRGQRLASLATPCLDPNCSCPLPEVIARHCVTISKAVLEFFQVLDAELARLRHASGQVLNFGPCPREAGPTCPVCRERRLALLENAGCKDAACEDCWASWFSTQLHQCRMEKRAAVMCIGACCGKEAGAALWQHACTRREDVKKMESQLAFRRRLVANPLYPAEVQEECPTYGCVGLGYRGSDTVMCFICEQQWPCEGATTAEIPKELDPNSTELLRPGEVMKQCPKCQMHIIKNGGCDHMTCKCRHEFWWSTLLPYGPSSGVPLPPPPPVPLQ